MSTVFDGYEPVQGRHPAPQRAARWSRIGRRARPSRYGLFNAQDRGDAVLRTRAPPVYTGMIVGSDRAPGDIDVNVCKKKHLTNIRNGRRRGDRAEADRRAHS